MENAKNALFLIIIFISLVIINNKIATNKQRNLTKLKLVN